MGRGHKLTFMKFLNYLRHGFMRIFSLPQSEEAKKLLDVHAADYREKYLFRNPKYENQKKLNRFEFQVFSQNGEDGILQEIFRRIGTTNKTFVEFGAGTGLENNTAHLLLRGWKGHWFEADEAHVKSIQEQFHTLFQNGMLFLAQVFITAENIESLFVRSGVPKDFDLLSIDIDGNDYWVWKKIVNFSPRVVVIEYNALFRPGTDWIIKYNPSHAWKKTSYYGASISSLERLGREKGYSLVGCDFTGTNAFFVRNDLLQDKFLEPFTAENHYEPPRYFLMRKIGHKREWGEFETNS